MKNCSFCILNFSFKSDFVWEEIANVRPSVSSPDETPRSSSKILRCASYFQLSSRCFSWWWNTASHVWYITSNTRRSVSSDIQTRRSDITNTRRGVSSDIQLLRSNISNNNPSINNQQSIWHPNTEKCNGKNGVQSNFLTPTFYCAFHKHANTKVKKATDNCVFRCCQSS